jgi:hypothetical protein
LESLEWLGSPNSTPERKKSISSKEIAPASELRIRLLERIRQDASKRAGNYRTTAHDFAKDVEIEIDDRAPVSPGDDPGAYVQAWIWISHDNVKENKTKGDR